VTRIAALCRNTGSSGTNQAERLTGNVVCAMFRHILPALDPHLHTHCVMFNATFDAAENRWKAFPITKMLQSAGNSRRMCITMSSPAISTTRYEIENKPRGDFEIKGVSRELQSRFSKRHKEIDASIESLLKEKARTGKWQFEGTALANRQAQRAVKSRESPLHELQRLWDSQLTGDERQSLKHWLASKKQRFQPSSLTTQTAIHGQRNTCSTAVRSFANTKSGARLWNTGRGAEFGFRTSRRPDVNEITSAMQMRRPNHNTGDSKL